MRVPINTKGVQIIKVTCVDNGKTIDAELHDVKPNRITVVLPGFQKLTMNKVPNKVDLYVADQFGMEFHARYQR